MFFSVGIIAFALSFQVEGQAPAAPSDATSPTPSLEQKISEPKTLKQPRFTESGNSENILNSTPQTAREQALQNLLKEETKENPKINPQISTDNQSPEALILKKVPANWYQSTTELFNYCVSVNFAHPICPQINRGNLSGFDFQSEFFKAPIGELNDKTLFQATTLYEVNRAPAYWLVGLKLDGKKPENVDERLWSEAKYLWAKVLFDRHEHEKSLKILDSLVDEYKGKALFHQQRAWAQFFNKEFDKALGSIVSAESPMIYPIPFFEKYFLKALIEKENCLYQDAVKTIQYGRQQLKTASPDPSKHPWVVLCEREGLGTTCSRLQSWYRNIYAAKIKSSMDDLDLLEIELRDRLTPGQKEKSDSPIVWPFAGENWSDELGHYSVPIKSKC